MATKLHVYGYIVMYGCGSWTLRKNEETRLDSFEMKGLRKILWFCGQQRKQWVGSQQSWSKEETVRHCRSNETSILWSHHEETRSCLQKEIMQGTMPGGAHRQGRPRTAWIVDRTPRGRAKNRTECWLYIMLAVVELNFIMVMHIYVCLL